MKIIDVLDRYLMATNENRDRRSHYASDANACVRQLVYKWRKVEMSDPPTPGDVLKWRMGYAAEELVTKALEWAKAQGEIADFEAQVRKEIEIPGLRYPVVCKLDYVIYPPQGEAEGLEVKSMFGRGIINIQRTGKPKPDHLVQCRFYMHFGGRPVHTLVYLGRDFGYRTEFEIRLEGAEGYMTINGEPVGIEPIEYYIERFRRIETYLLLSDPVNPQPVDPPRDFIHAIKDGELRDKFTYQKVEYKTDWQCAYCEWRKRCWIPEVGKYPVHNAQMFADRDAVKPEQDEEEA